MGIRFLVLGTAVAMLAAVECQAQVLTPGAAVSAPAANQVIPQPPQPPQPPTEAQLNAALQARANANAAVTTPVTTVPQTTVPQTVAPGAVVAPPNTAVAPGAATSTAIVAPTVAPTPGVVQTVPGVTIPGGNNAWRYNYQNGRWFYYGPQNNWVYWNGSSWMAPTAYRAGALTPGQERRMERRAERRTP